MNKEQQETWLSLHKKLYALYGNCFAFQIAEGWHYQIVREDKTRLDITISYEDLREKSATQLLNTITKNDKQKKPAKKPKRNRKPSAEE
jgi:hypothetical protein